MHKSPNDSKAYRHLTLANGLKVLLVHDSAAATAAAAMAVNVGHFHDPDDREGMSHFLEHMLFLGTEKYPQSGDYQDFISRHGGHHNAWTGTEFTNFFFDIEAEYFEPALDRFAQFFIAPLFTEEQVDKERQAIESEYQLKLKDDVRRQYQVNKETTNPAHPFAKFSVGNLQTLADFDGRKARDELLAFYEQEYCSSRMSLVLLAPTSLDQLEQLCRAMFGAVIDRQLPKWKIKAPLYTPKELTLEIKVNPVKDTKKLFVSFALPDISQYYQTKPLTYLSHLLGNEYPKSLFSVLKQQGWINTLSAGGGISGSNFKDFSVSFSLTDEGLSHVDDIIEALFGYIALIKGQGIDRWRYQEKHAIVEQAFQFQEVGRAIDLVSHLAINMHHYPAQDVIYGDYVMANYDETLIRNMLDYFRPDNLRMLISAQGQDTDRTARWYHTPYRVEVIDTTRLSRWQKAQTPLALALPPANPFIAHNIAPRPQAPGPNIPTLLTDKPGYRVWYKKDEQFNVPKGSLYIAVDCEHAVKNVRNIALTRIAVELFLDHLSELTYPAEIAGLGYRIYAHQGGFTLHLSGFTAKLPLLLQLILSARKFGKVDPQRFAIIKQQLIRNWHNQKKGKPISQLFSQLTSLLQPANPPAVDLAAALEDVSLDEMPGFIEALYQQVHVEVLAHGDWLQGEVEELSTYLQKELAPNAAPGAETQRRLVDISGQGSLVRQVHCDHNDSAMIVYYQSSDTASLSIALYTLANHIMSSGFFHELRTQQQLGYVVGSGNLPLNRHPGIIFYVQSPVASPEHLLNCINEFIDSFHLVLMELSQAQWDMSRQGLIAKMREPDTNLKARSQRYWVSIGNKDWQFSQREQVADAIDKLSRADLIRFVVSLKSRFSDRLIVCSQGQAHESHAPLTIGKAIEEADSFRSSAKKFIN
ncbi:insulinase family protein [Motilimonas pumila]|uniref:Protease 3 n=1 Tax=Motilimonas pumila TaxID=2303987 RepID=A0A418YGC2_9GAMM|nr:insulinase family protein [Motilimonas pumila]RJG48684.1 insulinase family protein [Motilimonas pumila]